MHLLPLLRACLSRTGGFTEKTLTPSSHRDRTSRTDCADGLVEHGLEALLRKGRALQVLHGSDVLSHCHTLRVLDRCHASSHQARMCQRSTDDRTDERAYVTFPSVFQLYSGLHEDPVSCPRARWMWRERDARSPDATGPHNLMRDPHHKSQGRQTLVRTFS